MNEEKPRAQITFTAALEDVPRVVIDLLKAADKTLRKFKFIEHLPVTPRILSMNYDEKFIGMILKTINEYREMLFELDTRLGECAGILEGFLASLNAKEPEKIATDVQAG